MKSQIDEHISMIIETGKSNKILKKYALKVDKYVKKIPIKDLIYPKFRYYDSDYNKNDSKYAYVTIIFNGCGYIPAIMTLGNSLRIVKSKHKLICLVQDKDEYGLEGIKKKIIDDINKIYDLVIGVDIIKLDCKSKYFLEQEIFYKYIKYYATKNNILGLIEYEKIIYLDASCIVNKNIDNIFEEYDKSTYKYNDYLNEWKLTEQMSLHGNFLYILPSIYYYNKLLILIKEYDIYIAKYFFLYSPDEIMFYYSIYPNWNNTPKKMFNYFTINLPYISNSYSINKEINYEKLKNNNISIYSYVRDKPFRLYASLKTDLEINTIINYKAFDKIVKNLIEKKPEMLIYFEYIKTFRFTYF